MSETVGFIGLGTMGGPMAANLARAGVPLIVHDANPRATEPLAATAGVRVAGAPAEVAAAAAVLFTCLPDDAAVSAVYLGPHGIVEGGHRGLITCDCSTVSPETTLELHRTLATRGIAHLDTPMLGSQPQAIAGEIFFIVGGDREPVEATARYLKIMGRLHMHVGPAGTGNRIKLLHNGLAAVTAVAVAEALAVCVRAGVDPRVFDEVVRNGGGMAYGTYFERRVRRILDGEFTPTFMTTLMLKDAGLALAQAESVDVRTPLLAEARRTYQEAVEAGWGQEDFSAVTHVLERRIGRRISRS